MAKIRNEEIKELQQHLLDSKDYVHEIKKALQDMTMKKAKTEAFYMEEHKFLEGTRVRLNAEVDDKDATP